MHGRKKILIITMSTYALGLIGCPLSIPLKSYCCSASSRASARRAVDGSFHCSAAIPLHR